MKALSVRQPWASLIAEGEKGIEVRTWRTHYRGPLLIVASARKHGDLPTGCALAVVELVDVRPLRATQADMSAACMDWPEDWEDGRLWAWVLRLDAAVRPWRVRGRLGLYDLPMCAGPLGPEMVDRSSQSCSVCGAEVPMVPFLLLTKTSDLHPA